MNKKIYIHAHMEPEGVIPADTLQFSSVESSEQSTSAGEKIGCKCRDDLSDHRE